MITYYAYAKNDEGQIGQLFVTRKAGKQISQKWTGKIYHDAAAAAEDMIRLNCG